MLPVPRYRYFGGGEIPSYNGAGTPGVDYAHTLGDGPRVGPSINPAFRDPNYVSNAPHSAVTYTTPTPSPSASPFRDVRPTRGYEDGYGLDPSNTRGNPFYDWNTTPAVATTPAVPSNILTQFNPLPANAPHSALDFSGDYTPGNAPHSALDFGGDYTPGNAPHSALDFSGDYTPGNAPHSALDFSGDYTPGNAPHSAVDYTPDSSSLPWWKEQTGLAPFVASSPSPDTPSPTPNADSASPTPTPSPSPTSEPVPSPEPTPTPDPTPDPTPTPSPDPTPSPSPTPEPSSSVIPDASQSPTPTPTPTQLGTAPPGYQGNLRDFGAPFNLSPNPPLNAVQTGNVLFGAQTPQFNSTRHTWEWFSPDGQMHSIPAASSADADSAPPTVTGDTELHDNAANPPVAENPYGSPGEFDAPPAAIRMEPNAPPGMTIVGHDKSNGQPIYKDAQGNLHVNPGTGKPVIGSRWDFTQGRYVNNNNATGAQHDWRAANALEMWAQGLFGNVNQGQDERSLRSGGGQISHLDEFGNLTQTGTLAANARSNIQLYRPFVYGSQGGGRPLGGGFATTGVGAGG